MLPIVILVAVACVVFFSCRLWHNSLCGPHLTVPRYKDQWRIKSYLKVEDNCPYQAQNDGWSSVCNVCGMNVYKFDLKQIKTAKENMTIKDLTVEKSNRKIFFSFKVPYKFDFLEVLSQAPAFRSW